MAHYGTVSKTGDYFQNERLNSSEWFEFDADDHTRALNQATRLIENLNFIGDKADDAQELEFPRGTDTTVPKDIEIACYEVAFALLVEGRDVEFESDQHPEVAASLGQGRVRTDPNARQEHVAHSIPSVAAWRHLKPYLRPRDTVTLSRVS